MHPLLLAICLILNTTAGAPVRVLDGESAQPRYYAGDEVPEAYRSRRTSFMGSVHYQFSVPPGDYQVVLGFLEHPRHPTMPVSNILEIEIEGERVRTVDVARELGADQPHDLAFSARDRDGDGRLDVVISTSADSVERNAFLSRLVLKQGETVLADVNCGAEGPGVEVAMVQPERGPSPWNAVLSSGNQWAYFGTQGEVREIWARGAAYFPDVPRYCLASGSLSLQADGKWIDTRSLPWSYRWAGDSNILSLATKFGDGFVTLNAFSRMNEDLLVLQYKVPEGTDFRYTWSSQYQDFDAPILRQWEHGVLLENHTLGTIGLACSAPVEVEHATDTHQITLSGRTDGETLSVYIAVGREPEAVQRGLRVATPLDAQALLNRETTAWKKWLASGTTVTTPDAAVNRMARRALLNIRGNMFDNGVIIAGSDGWYKNTWIRDGGYSVMGLDLFGHHDLPARFYRYWLADEGFSYGGENECQQPAIGILGFLHHYRLTGDRAFLADTWKYVEHFADYYAGRIEKEGMIGTAEEWINQIPAKTAWPNSEIYAGMRAAAEIARLLGKSRATDWDAAADRLQRAIELQGYDTALGRFRPLSGELATDDRVDSGMLNVARLGIFAPGVSASTPDHPRTTSTIEQIKWRLEHEDYTISRFTGNPNGHGYPGGQWPIWPISTAWMAQYHLLLGEPDAALPYLRGVAHKQGYPYDDALWYLPEQISLDGRPVSTRNLTWSNGEYLTTLMMLLVGQRPHPDEGWVELSPALPLEWDRAEAVHVDLLGASTTLRHARQGGRHTITLIHEAGPAVSLGFRLPARAMPDPKSTTVNGTSTAWTSSPGFLTLPGRWTLSPEHPELVLEIDETAPPPCPVHWSGVGYPGMTGLDAIAGASPEAARLRAALMHLLQLPADTTRVGVRFAPAGLPPSDYRIQQLPDSGLGRPVFVQYGDAMGAIRAMRRLANEAERDFHVHRLPAARAADPELQRHLGR